MTLCTVSRIDTKVSRAMDTNAASANFSVETYSVNTAHGETEALKRTKSDIRRADLSNGILLYACGLEIVTRIKWRGNSANLLAIARHRNSLTYNSPLSTFNKFLYFVSF